MSAAQAASEAIASLPWWLPGVQPATAVAAFFAAVFSAWAAARSAKAAEANRLIGQGAAVSRLLDTYSNSDMAQALKTIRKVAPMIQDRTANPVMGGTWFDPAASVLLGAKGGEDKVHEAGRRLHWWVKQADILRRNGALNAEVFKQAVVETNGYRLWAEVWVPYLKADPLEDQADDNLAWANVLLSNFPPARQDPTKSVEE